MYYVNTHTHKFIKLQRFDVRTISMITIILWWINQSKKCGPFYFLCVCKNKCVGTSREQGANFLRRITDDSHDMHCSSVQTLATTNRILLGEVQNKFIMPITTPPALVSCNLQTLPQICATIHRLESIDTAYTVVKPRSGTWVAKLINAWELEFNAFTRCMPHPPPA